MSEERERKRERKRKEREKSDRVTDRVTEWLSANVAAVDNWSSVKHPRRATFFAVETEAATRLRKHFGLRLVVYPRSPSLDQQAADAKQPLVTLASAVDFHETDSQPFVRTVRQRLSSVLGACMAL